MLWEPHSDRYTGVYRISKEYLYKNAFGNKIIFEEMNEDFDLTFRYQWNSSDNRFGFVKKSSLVNNSNQALEVTVLDGIQNLLALWSSNGPPTNQKQPDGCLQEELNCTKEPGLASLLSVRSLWTEPNPVKHSKLMSFGARAFSIQKSYFLAYNWLQFRKGNEISMKLISELKKEPISFHSRFDIDPHVQKNWIIIADVNQTMVDVSELRELIKNDKDILATVQRDIDLGSKNLMELNASADGLQLTADKLMNTRHFSNTLFNIMRGGIFDEGYTIEKWDFTDYLSKITIIRVFKKKEDLFKCRMLFHWITSWELAKQDDTKISGVLANGIPAS